jgi:hypothetical protein
LRREGRLLGAIVAAFLTAQICIIWLAANGPFVDEGLYTVAGMRVLEGKGLSDGYLTWFNGSPFVWPVLAALGHHLGGLSGARLVAVLLSTVTLVAFARTAAALFGESSARWSTVAFALNGLFVALGHFAVYDVPALTGIAVAMWCVTRSARSHDVRWLRAAATAFAFAVITKYGYMPMVVPLVGLLLSVTDRRHRAWSLLVFLFTAGAIVAAYCLLVFGTLVPTSSATYLSQPFRVSRSDIALHQVVYGIAPLVLACFGAVAVWKTRRRLLAVTCLMALAISPAFHVWTANFVSSQKHAVPGFMFAYLLAGATLARLTTARSRLALPLVVIVLTLWGSFQWFWQENSWSDNRRVARYLAQNMTQGERVLADSSWTYTLSLYPRQLIDSPFDVLDTNYSPGLDEVDLCRIPWLIGKGDTGDIISNAVVRCGHRLVLASTTQQYYLDTTRLRKRAYTGVGAYTGVIELYRLAKPAAASVE